MKYILLFVACFFTLQANAQQSIAGGRVFYRFSHIRDTTQKQNVFREETATTFTTDASLYRSYTRMTEDSMRAVQLKNATGNNIRIQPSRSTIERKYYNFTEGKHTTIRPWIGDTLLIENPYSSIQWKLQKDSRDIGGLRCYMATGYFGGRKYLAWYAPEIPSRAGPWKLNGLPGLIVEAADSTGTVRFEFTRLQNLSSASAALQLPAGRKLKPEEWQRLMDQFRQNPEAYANAQLNAARPPDQQTTFKIENSGVAKNSLNRAGINNPLEISDK